VCGIFSVVWCVVVCSPKHGPARAAVREVLTDGLVVVPNTQQTYGFLVNGLADRQTECGLVQHGEVHIEGENLTSLKLQADRGWISQQEVKRFYRESRLKARLEFPGQFPP